MEELGKSVSNLQNEQHDFYLSSTNPLARTEKLQEFCKFLQDKELSVHL